MNRVVRAARGPAMTAKGWPQEAAMRMLMNKLDPEVAARPRDLVVCGGCGPHPLAGCHETILFAGDHGIRLPAPGSQRSDPKAG